MKILIKYTVAYRERERSSVFLNEILIKFMAIWSSALQTTNLFINDPCLEVLAEKCNELCLFFGNAFPPALNKCVKHLI